MPKMSGTTTDRVETPVALFTLDGNQYPAFAIAGPKIEKGDLVTVQKDITLPKNRWRKSLRRTLGAGMVSSYEHLCTLYQLPRCFEKVDVISLEGTVVGSFPSGPLRHGIFPIRQGLLVENEEAEVRFYQELVVQLVLEGRLAQEEVEKGFSRLAKLAAVTRQSGATRHEAALATSRALSLGKRLIQEQSK